MTARRPGKATSGKTNITSTAELARHLGLSRWAVSRALNNHDGVSSATAQKVRAAMAKSGFTPSVHARGLRGARTGAIGICFRELNTPITIQKISHVQRLVRARGFRPLIELSQLDQRTASDVVEHFIAMRVEGVLFVDTSVGAESDQRVSQLRACGIPAAFLEPLGTIDGNAVYLDREEAMAAVTQQLLNLGHERLALLGISRKFPLGRPRFAGIERAFRAAGKDLGQHVLVVDKPERRHLGLLYGHELAVEMLALADRPTALIALNDEVAAGAMWHLQRTGFRIPGDFSLFGFDNLMLAAQTNPTLSSVDHNVEETAAAAVDLLFQLIQLGPAATLPAVKIPPRLVVRESVTQRPALPARK